ncbi:TonB-dependent receptor [Aestuariibacter halophilus]|uniref:TonB-dependent receptor n=1 Tax=Fluctibacter halophilus TaxID=226011 RepID=A0ABS8G898_9ALTE|nr:TonB-dependent receptor plug domain-containing protein [Aestuariibacter halophilus]MCC2616684.1 TonB-dependent receptor [Aestuariibacter halophilus]
MKYTPHKLANAVALACAAIGFCAHAEDADNSVEKITVHGALVEQPLRTLATSISVIGSEGIADRQAQHLETILNRAANVNFASGASRGRFMQIRGIGERSQFVDPINPSVGYLVDGINYSGMAAGASLFDVEQVEVFKGPNSARFGTDGLAGVINIISRAPTDDTRINLSAGIANYDSWHVGAAIGGAVTDGLNYRLSLHQQTSDGFIENTFLQRDDTNNVDERTARLKLAWQASQNWTFNAVMHAIDVDNGYDAFSLDRDRTTLSDEPGFDRQDSDAYALSAHYAGWDNMQLETRITRLDADLGYGYDEDWSYVGIAPYDPINDPDGYFAEYSSTDHYFRDRTDHTFSMKLHSLPGSDSVWSLGIYASDEDEHLLRNYFDWDIWGPATFNSDVRRKEQAVFGSYQWHLDANSWISTSLRLARQQLDYADVRGIEADLDESDWGAEISYHLKTSDSTMLYASLLRSYKMGGANGEALGKAEDPELAVFREILLDNATFEGESMRGLEFGVKGENPSGTLQLNATAFYQWRDDIQYKNWILQDQTFVGFYNNAADGHNYGVEIELRHTLNEALSWFANLGYLRTEINGITRQDSGEVLDGREQAHAPQYQANVGLRWTISPAWEALLEVDRKDAFFYSYSHDQISDIQTLTHASVTYRHDGWAVSLYARNLFDRDVANRGFYFGNDPRDGYTTHLYEQWGEPRRVGITVRYQY